jgi:molybdopterin-guanine dinucleotide biosynthesis protein A/uridine kinase
MRLAAVILAGGKSSRFGTDKLAADLDGLSLLERAMGYLSADAELIIVGPERPIGRFARFVREDPAGTGPAAEVVAGLRAALDTNPEAIVVLPGDAPTAGRTAMALLAALDEGNTWALMATDPAGREQPLQLALRPEAASTLVELAGESGGAGQSARQLVGQLSPRSVNVTAQDHFDIDTTDQLRAWQLRNSPAVRAVLAALHGRGVVDCPSTSSGPVSKPYVIAIDGPSGSGKSTLAAALALRLPATVIDGDDFYSSQLPALSEAERDAMSEADAATVVIDWRRLRSEALAPLLERQAACYMPYDWEAGDGSLASEKQLPAADVIIIDGVYSARPELADLIDLRVLVDVEPGVRYQRLAQRQDAPMWAEFWDRAERHYFTEVQPPEVFDLWISTEELDNGKDT